MAKKNDEIYITEHTLELRHAAVGKFLDVRGKVADYIKDKKFFTHWAIQENTISFYDDGSALNKPKATISFNAIAFITTNPPTKNFFQEKAISFWNAVSSNEDYIIPSISRFGARTKCYIPVKDLTFSKIHERIYSKLFSSEFVQKVGTLADLQLVLDLKEKEYNIRLILGPVKENEAGRYFSFQDKAFVSPGLYIDIDYFKFSAPHEKIKSSLNEAMELTWKRIDSIVDIIGI